MNILITYQSPWWNAAAYYSFILVKALQLNGHKVYFVGASDVPAAQKISRLGINTFDMNLFVHSPFRFISNIRRIKKIISSKKIDLLIPISAPGHIISGIINKFYETNLPIIKVCLDNVPPATNMFNRYLHNKLTDFFIFPGKPTKNRYDKIFEIKKFKIFHAPLDLIEFTNYSPVENIKESLNIPQDKVIVSFIGRFSPEKGIFFLVDIIREVVERTDKIYFILSGSEEPITHSEVWDKIKEYGLQNFVKIINKVEDARKLISITDIGLLSSRTSELICRIAMEYMAFKKPVVAPNLNVIPEVVEDKNTGFIYDLNDSGMAADFILELTNNNDLRKKMSINSFERINNIYDLKKFREELEQILMKVK